MKCVSIKISCKARGQATYNGKKGKKSLLFFPKSPSTTVSSGKVVFSLQKSVLKQRWVMDAMLAQV